MFAPAIAASELLNMIKLSQLREIGSTQQKMDMDLRATVRSLSKQNMDLLQKAYGFDSDNTGVRRELVRSFFFDNNLVQALSFVSKSNNYACMPLNASPECWLIRASLLAKEGYDEDAIRSWRWGVDLAARRWDRGQDVLVESSGIYVYHLLVKRHPERVDWRLSLMRLLWQAGRQKEASDEAVFLARHESFAEPEIRGAALMSLAQFEEMMGETVRAVRAYEDALAENSKFALAYVRLRSLYASLGEVEQAATIERQLASLASKRSLPTRLQLTGGGGRLVGYDVGTQSVGNTPLLDLVLYWRLPENWLPTETGWVHAQDHWLQFVKLPNLALNAGFEQDAWVGEGVPIGYAIPNWMYVSDGEQGLIWVERGGKMSKIFRQLKHDDGKNQDHPLAVELLPLRVRPGECFLFDAYIGGGPGNANATLWWRDEHNNYITHDNILGKLHDADPAVRCAPPGSSWMHFVLSLSEGEMEWDNVVIVQLPDMDN